MTLPTNKNRLFLIDGMAVAYRMYFAFARNPLINSRGENVSAVYGFTTMLLNLLDNEKPDYFAVIFDTPEPTFRHEMYEQYKAQRAEMPDDMVEQLPRLRQMLDILRIPQLEQPGFEADDIIGTLVKKAKEKGIKTVIVTGDKDMMQLVNSDTVMLLPGRGGADPQWLDETGVERKIGLPPCRIIDYLALMGDSSDNIPGVPGVGPKTAAIVLLFSLGKPAFPVDTHIHRISGRLEIRPDKMSAEKAHDHLAALFPPDSYYAVHLNLIRLGREICHARNPECPRCPLRPLCPYPARRPVDSEG